MASERGGMMEWKTLQKLMSSFPRSFINQYGEFIAHEKANEYFIVAKCKDELEIKCKVIEWLSRGAYKTEPFGTKAKNDEFHKFMLGGINSFLGTNFSEDDMIPIYTYLGNAVNHELTINFVCSGYDLNILKEVE